MTTIQIQVNDDSIVQKIIAYLKRFKVPVKVLDTDDEELTEQDIDTAILQKMILTEDDADFETVSSDEAEHFLSKLRQGIL
jgi:restriction endonuclease